MDSVDGVGMLSAATMCKRCVCTDRMSGLHVDDFGVCSDCRGDDIQPPFPPERYSLTLDRRLRRLEHEEIPYHVMVMVSGGKDSAYLLYWLRKNYKLRVLAFGVIHPFVNELARRNMDKVAAELGIELVKFHVDESMSRSVLRRAIFRGEEYGLGEMAVCSACSALYHHLSLKTAMERRIPYLMDGSSPSQQPCPTFISSSNMRKHYMKHDRPRGVFRLLHDVCRENGCEGSIYDADFSTDNLAFPSKVSPYTFMQYEPERFIRELSMAGVMEPDVLRSNKTNCDLLHFYSLLTYQRYGCHPYQRTFAVGVRRGMPSLLDDFLQTEDQPLSREEHIAILGELHSIARHVCTHSATNTDLPDPLIMAPVLAVHAGEELLRDYVALLVSAAEKYCHYFGINLLETG